MFQRTQNVNINWSWSKTISGTWSFNFYIPLPPPVSFIGINFGFSATFSVTVGLGINGSSAPSVYTCVFTANVGTAIDVDASAALRVVVIEGGVYIGGTLVSVNTDPKLTLIYKYGLTPKKLQVLFDWKFHIRAFQFSFGFFWRYWYPFRWSDRKIIKSWVISNGITKTYPIMTINKEYNL